MDASLCFSEAQHKDKGEVSLVVKWWPAAAATLLAAALVLPRLGQRPLWGDEADTALHAQSILLTGLPTVHTDRWVISYWQLTASDSLIQDRVPWLPFYMTAASFAIFGPGAWSARLPFALMAIACVPCLYFFTRRLCDDELTAALAGLLCAVSVPFLLYARQCRYYSPLMLLTVLACWSYLHLTTKRKLWIALFALACVLLFYTNSLTGVSFMVAMAAVAVIFDRRRDRLLAFAAAAIGMAVLALPWLLYSARSVAPPLDEEGEAAALLRLVHQRGEIGLRLSAMYVRDYARAGFFPILLLPILAAAALVWRRVRAPALRLCTIIIVMTCVTSLLYFQVALLPGWDFPSSTRHHAGLIPLFAVLVAICCAFVARWNRWVAAAVVVLLAGTSLLAEPLNTLRRRPAVTGLVSRWSPMANYLYEITHDIDDASAAVVRHLNELGERADRVLVAPPWMSDILAFHTPLQYCQPPQGKYPPRATARSRLPRHLATANDLDWFVDFHGAYESYGDFEPAPVPAVHSDDAAKPELWWHAFKTLQPRPGDRLPVIYRRTRD